ncbi:MAG: helix-turn-helix transcriptional regulator, partial [Acidobacteriaceae bacterium]|nr:helix-turn-helix transcriptional regulator [Acidobacteriaceae bacterium]
MKPKDPGTGSDVVLAKLSEVPFIETLRPFIQDLPDEQKGWLARARDPVIGEALALLHKNPSHPWRIANLAHQVGVSRTRFVERFVTFWESRRCRISHGGDSSSLP